MIYYFKRYFFGGRGPDQFGYLLKIRTQSTFIKEQVRSVGKIMFQAFWMIRGGGAILKRTLQGLLNSISKIYSRLLLQIIWILSWTQLLKWLPLI